MLFPSQNSSNSLPWNRKTPLGYAGEIMYFLWTAEGYIFVNAAIVLLFVAICLHHRAFYEMYCFELNKFNRTDEHRNNQQFLTELIEFQLSFKKCV